MSGTPWKITSWNRERGLGTIACDGQDEQHFDASIALAGDFEVGEGVHVHLQPHADSFRVVKLWPDDPRCPPPPGSPVEPPAPDPDVESRATLVLGSLSICIDYRVHWPSTGELVVQADDAAFAYGCEYEVVFRGIEYVELPTVWGGKSFRVANARERAYLASRCELDAHSVGIKVADDARRAYFVVCSAVEVRPGRRGE